MSDTEQPLRQIDSLQRKLRPIRVLGGIGVVAACLTAVISPWLLTRLPPQRTSADQRQAQHEQTGDSAALQTRDPGSTQPYTPEFDRLLPLSSSGDIERQTTVPGLSPPSGSSERSDAKTEPAATPEPSTLVVAPPTTPTQSSEAVAALATDAPPAVAVTPERADDAEPPNEQAEAKLQDAPSATGSVSIPEPPSRPAFARRSAQTLPPKMVRAPLPKAFKPSADRDQRGVSGQRQAALPEPTSPPASIRASDKGRPAPVHRAKAVPTTRQALAAKAKPLSVVLPNSLLPLGPN